jgi:predicted GNAT superfamily acetyltransferase
MTASLEVRKCQTLEEFHLCVALQREVWGEVDLELEPTAMFVVASHTGGQVLGAFDGERLAGFTMAVVGWRDSAPYLHSHMTAVHPDYRNRGVGRMLKLFQREDALLRGIRLVLWTFDPLEFRNAYFNLNRLGAISREFLPNLYGVTTSPLHRGLPTDRLVAEWQLDSQRVVAAVAGLAVQIPDHFVAVELPANYGTSGARDLHISQTAALQERLRAGFAIYFKRNYAVVAVRTDPSAPAYLFAPWSDF